MNSCNPEVKDVRLSSTILCVSSCPEEQLDTLEEVQLFADKNGRHQGTGLALPPEGGNHSGVTCADLGETDSPGTAFSAKLEIVIACGSLFLCARGHQCFLLGLVQPHSALSGIYLKP